MKYLWDTTTGNIRRVSRRFLWEKDEYTLWRENDRIRNCQPTEARGKVVILAMGSDGFNTRGKVRPALFFPPYSRVLGQCGIGSVYVSDMAALEYELSLSDKMPIILIDLVHEVRDELSAYDISSVLERKPRAIFNSRRIAKIIRDKKETNAFLSQNGIMMPKPAGRESKMIFSNARVGSNEEVYVHYDASEMDERRYNTEFIDTRVRVGDTVYYTTIRLMCIGSRLLQVFVRARDERENNPSVHAKNTPQDWKLLDHLYGLLVAPRIQECHSLAEILGSVLGPGFYAHDVLVDNRSGDLVLCETGFKFFDDSYWKRMRRIVDDREFQYNVVDQANYAKCAASTFIAYCEEMGFL